jgi:predicted dienelactone hydrolase
MTKSGLVRNELMEIGLGRESGTSVALRPLVSDESIAPERRAHISDVIWSARQRFFVGALLALLMTATVGVDHAQGRSEVQSHASPFRVVDFEWIDSGRARAVPARLYWPDDTVRAARVPLIVFSHGMGGSRRGYSYLARYWAARGIASLHVQHVGSDSSLWAGNPLMLVSRLQSAAQESEALARGLDVRFALNRLLSGEAGAYNAGIDRKRIIAAGHSYGANTALVAVGAAVTRNGKRMEAHDTRFSAAILISSPPFYGERDVASVLNNVTVPTLHVTATDDVIRIPGYYSAVTDRLAIYNAIATPRKSLVVFEGGSHSMFTDRGLTGGRELNPKVKAATAELTLAFLDLIFDGNRSDMMQWNLKWKPILALSPGVFPVSGPVAQSRKERTTTANPHMSR